MIPPSHDLHASVEVSGYVIEMLRDTFENWQSEFLQLLWQVVGLTILLYVGSPQSKEARTGPRRCSRRFCARSIPRAPKQPSPNSTSSIRQSDQPVASTVARAPRSNSEARWPVTVVRKAGLSGRLVPKISVIANNPSASLVAS